MLKLNLANKKSKLTVFLKDFSGRTLFTKDLYDVPAGKTEHRLGVKGKVYPHGVYGLQVVSVLDGESKTIVVVK